MDLGIVFSVGRMGFLVGSRGSFAVLAERRGI